MHGRIQRVAEDAAIELAARQPVAVLTGVDAAVLQDQIPYLLGDRAHQLRLTGLAQVENGRMCEHPTEQWP